MSARIYDYWVRAECLFCDEPPMDGRDVCERHERCHASTTGSWLDAEVAS